MCTSTPASAIQVRAVCRCRCLTVASGGSGTNAAGGRAPGLPSRDVDHRFWNVDPRSGGAARVAVVPPPHGPVTSRSFWSRPTVTRSRVGRSGLDGRDCLTLTALRRLRNLSTATWVGRRSTWSSTTVARPRSEPTLCAMSIGQHRCVGSKVSFVNTDRWSLESEVCTRVLPGTTAKWSS